MEKDRELMGADRNRNRPTDRQTDLTRGGGGAGRLTQAAGRTTKFKIISDLSEE